MMIFLANWWRGHVRIHPIFHGTYVVWSSDSNIKGGLKLRNLWRFLHLTKLTGAERREWMGMDGNGLWVYDKVYGSFSPDLKHQKLPFPNPMKPAELPSPNSDRLVRWELLLSFRLRPAKRGRRLWDWRGFHCTDEDQPMWNSIFCWFSPTNHRTSAGNYGFIWVYQPNLWVFAFFPETKSGINIRS